LALVMPEPLAAGREYSAANTPARRTTASGAQKQILRKDFMDTDFQACKKGLRLCFPSHL
jgi:hypothetical protein